MINKFTKKLGLIIVFFVLSSLVWAKSQMSPLETTWFYQVGDDTSWSKPEGLKSGNWEEVSIPGSFVGDKDGFFWLKAKINLPSEYTAQECFLELGCSIASMEVFIDGQIMGRNGTISPAHVSHVNNTVVPVPVKSASNGIIDVSIRCKSNGSHTTFTPFFIVNKDRFVSISIYQPLLNTTVYYMMAAVCFFLGLYYLLQFLLDRRDRASNYFGLTLLFISVYFFDMASEIVLFSFPWQLAISRLCLVISVSFLVIFLTKFFERKMKPIVITSIVVDVIFAIAYAISTTNAIFQETLFTISLIPVFSGIIYIYVLLTKMTRQHKSNAKTMLIGISIGMLFGVHDIIYQATGNIPFAWLQGFAFFFIDMTMFIVVSLETIKNKKAINNYASTTAEQKNKLDSIIENAVVLSKEMIEISNSMHESVQNVVEAVYDSENTTKEIGKFIEDQNLAVKNTSNALSNLVESVKNVTGEVSTETEVVDTTISETGNLINGVNQVAGVIENAANFSNSLGSLTEKSSKDVTELVTIMESIKDASDQIIGIVHVVTDFSKKTNMLAMNASIEAAHSGIAGKGFTVIAHEIKKLAEASNDQAQKINDIVNDINTNIASSFELSKQVQTALENVSKEAADTSESVNESVRSMEIQREAGSRIKEATRMMGDSAGRVKKESDQQYAYSEQASENMSDLSKASELAEKSVKEIIVKNHILSGQADTLKILAQRAKDAAEKLDAIIRG